MRTHLPGRLAWATVGGSALLAIGTVVLSLQVENAGGPDRNRATLPFLLLVLVAALVYAGVGALIAAHRPRNPVGWSFCAIGLLLTALYAVKAWSDLALFTEPGAWGDPVWAIWLIAVLSPVQLLAPTVVLLFFPDGLVPSPRWRPVVHVAIGAAVVGAVALALRPGDIEPSDFPGVDNPLGIGPAVATVATVATAVGTVALLLAVASQVVRYRRADRRGRQQSRWIGFPALLNLVLWTASEFAPAPVDTVLWVAGFGALAALPVGAAVAILRHRLYEIDLIISRTLVYGILTAGVVGVYVVVVGYLSALFQTRANLLISLVATGIVAVSFSPVRDRVQRMVNRLVFGQRDDPYAVLSGLGRRLESALAPSAALQDVVETVAATLRLPYAEIRDRSGDGTETTVATTGSSDAPPLELPLVHHRERVGSLLLAPRRGEPRFAETERPLLEDLARQAAAAVSALRLTSELQRSRERLVAGREEERRRLRRDLHDGLGPQLAAQNLKVGSARAVCVDQPERAAELLAELEDDVTHALADLRRVIDDLRPPALDELGLVGAVEEMVLRYRTGRVRMHLQAISLPALPAAVEVAAYRIVAEALTNVVRHAAASTCEICLRLDGDLLLEVADDGTGVRMGPNAGIGLVSMRERASEIGGCCEIEPRPGGGTRVRARLPVPEVTGGR
jgi:signal transduction histidine kinase